MRLLLLRHAKSSWNRPGQLDYDRPLNGRGSRAAPTIGRYMRDHGLAPKRVLCSGAQRTRETLAHVLASLEANPDVLYADAIYDAASNRLLDIIREHGGVASPLLLVGHNPAIQELAIGLARASQGDHLDRMREKYPTAALAILEADIEDWRALAWRSARLAGFVRPRDLD